MQFVADVPHPASPAIPGSWFSNQGWLATAVLFLKEVATASNA